jgi:SAM-dependent methyltransferase
MLILRKSLRFIRCCEIWSNNQLGGFDTANFSRFLFLTIGILIASSWVQSAKGSNYLDVWEVSSLLWTMLFGAFFIAFRRSRESDLIEGIFKTIFIAILLCIGYLVYAKIDNLMKGNPLGELTQIALTIAPVLSIVAFTLFDYYDWKTAQVQKSKYMFWIVDAPFLVSTLIFTIYYWCLIFKLDLFNVMMASSKISVYSPSTPTELEHFNSFKSLNNFFGGATSLQLISNNIIFAILDCDAIRAINNKYNHGDNYRMFSSFCEVQPDRKKRLATSLIENISSKYASSSSDKGKISILDIGASDGELTFDLDREISERISNNTLPNTAFGRYGYKIHAIEPDWKAFLKLYKSAKNKEDSFVITHKSFEDFFEKAKSNSESKKFDIIIATHVLYHFSVNQWPQIIENCLGLLKRDGILVVTLDSNKSPIYQKKDEVLKLAQGNSVDFYGEYCFSEELQKVLNETNRLNNTSTFSCKSKLDFSTQPPSNSSQGAPTNTPTTSLDENRLIKCLSFLYRVDIQILPAIDELSRIFSASLNNKYQIDWEETIFIIKKPV